MLGGKHFDLGRMRGNEETIMIELTQEKREWIRQAYDEGTKYKEQGISIFDEVPVRALDYFKGRLAKRGIELAYDEEIVLFKDFTWLKYGREGLLITNKRLYYKYHLYFKVVELADIAGLQVDPYNTSNISFALKDGSTVEIYASELYKEVKEMVDILLTGTGLENEYDASGNRVVEVAEKTLKSNRVLSRVYAAFEWVEFLFSGFTGAYWLSNQYLSRHERFDASFYELTEVDPHLLHDSLHQFMDWFPLTSVQVYVLSFFITSSFLVMTVMIRKYGTLYKKKWRFVFDVLRCAFWLVLDVIFLMMALGWIGQVQWW